METSNDIYPLKPQEIELIKLMRTKYRFGTIEVMVRDGIPQDILKTVERTRLSTNNIDEPKFKSYT